MNACVCVHAVEEHPNYAECEGEIEYEGKTERCRCVHYEEDAG